MQTVPLQVQLAKEKCLLAHWYDETFNQVFFVTVVHSVHAHVSIYETEP